MLAACLSGVPGAAQECFVRADANADGAADASDAVCVLRFLFGDGSNPCARPGCLDALDVNGDLEIDVGDPVYLLFFLFRDGPTPPPPFDFGCSKAFGESLGCMEPTPCTLPYGLSLTIEDELVLYSIWTGAYQTVNEQMSHLSVLGLEPGKNVLGLNCEKPSRPLVRSLLLGPSLSPAAPADAGRSQYIPGGCEHWRYSQTFATELGPAAFRFDLDTCNIQEIEYRVTCCYLEDLCRGPDPPGVFSMRVTFDDGSPDLFYSCLDPELWQPSPASARLRLADGTSVEMHVFDGPARHLFRVRVEFRGRSLDITAYRSLIYAARPDKTRQEYRVLFPAPIEGIRGIDIVECARPASNADPCALSLERSRAYYLNESLVRIEEVELAAIEDL